MSAPASSLAETSLPWAKWSRSAIDTVGSRQFVGSLVKTLYHPNLHFLGFADDNRLLMTEQAKELAGPEPMKRLRLQTAQILDSSTRQIPDSLDRVVGQLTRTLDAHLAAHG